MFRIVIGHGGDAWRAGSSIPAFLFVAVNDA